MWSEVFSAVGLITLLGGGALVLFSQREKVNKQLLDEENAKLVRIHDLDQREISGLKKQVDLAEQKADVLQNVVTQAPNIAKLSADIAGQHKELIVVLTKLASGQGEMTKQLTRLAEVLGVQATRNNNAN